MATEPLAGSLRSCVQRTLPVDASTAKTVPPPETAATTPSASTGVPVKSPSVDCTFHTGRSLRAWVAVGPAVPPSRELAMSWPYIGHSPAPSGAGAAWGTRSNGLGAACAVAPDAVIASQPAAVVATASARARPPPTMPARTLSAGGTSRAGQPYSRAWDEEATGGHRVRGRARRVPGRRAGGEPDRRSAPALLRCRERRPGDGRRARRPGDPVVVRDL